MKIRLPNNELMSNDTLYFIGLPNLAYYRLWGESIQSYFSAKKESGEEAKAVEISFFQSGYENTDWYVCLANIPYSERLKEFVKCIIDKKPDVLCVYAIEHFFSKPTEKDIKEFLYDMYNLAIDCDCILIFGTDCRNETKSSLFYDAVLSIGKARIKKL